MSHSFQDISDASLDCSRTSIASAMRLQDMALDGRTMLTFGDVLWHQLVPSGYSLGGVPVVPSSPVSPVTLTPNLAKSAMKARGNFLQHHPLLQPLNFSPPLGPQLLPQQQPLLLHPCPSSPNFDFSLLVDSSNNNTPAMEHLESPQVEFLPSGTADGSLNEWAPSFSMASSHTNSNGLGIKMNKLRDPSEAQIKVDDPIDLDAILQRFSPPTRIQSQTQNRKNANSNSTVLPLRIQTQTSIVSPSFSSAGHGVDNMLLSGNSLSFLDFHFREHAFNPYHPTASTTATTGTKDQTSNSKTTHSNVKVRKRTQLSPTQRNFLLQVFAQNEMPNSKILKSVGERVGMSLRHVQFWFQNKRASERRKKEVRGVSRTAVV